MKRTLGYVTLGLLLASCGSEPPQLGESTTIIIEKNGENEDVENEGQKSLEEDAKKAEVLTTNEEEGEDSVLPPTMTAEVPISDNCADGACEPAEFALTIIKNGEIKNEEGEVVADGQTLIAKEGVKTQWQFDIGTMKEFKGRKFQFSLPEFSVEAGIKFKEKLAKSVWLEVDGLKEDAGFIPIIIDDITYCLENGYGDEDYCRNDADEFETNRQVLNIPYLVTKENKFSKFQTAACRLSSIARLFAPFDPSGTTAIATTITDKLLKCQE